MDDSERRDRDEHIEQLLAELSDLPPEERARRLDERCSDPEVRAEVERMLRAQDRLDEFAEVMGEIGEERENDPEEPPPGERIGRFELRGKIGEGGMGVVYEARDTRLGRNVALKFLPSHLGTDSTARERFLREARTASALDHPNVAPLLEIGDTEEGRPFLVMPYYEGPTLSEKIEAGSLSTAEALGLATQIARGLDAAHREGIVHRDVKPANVLLPDEETVKLTDFGLAKWLDRSGITRTNSVLGTFAYMSPEHARGAEVDHRTDLWSLGVLLYEMLAGERPFRGPYEEALLYQIVHEEPPDLRERCPDLPEGVIRLVEDLLEKDPDDRPASAEQVAERLSDLRAHLGAETSSETANRPRVGTNRLPGGIRSRKMLLGIAAGAVLLGALSLLVIGEGSPFGGLMEERGSGGVPVGPERSDRAVAVLPFEVTGGASEDWRDGMVTMLSTGLDGAGDLRAITDRRMFAALDGVDSTERANGSDPGLLAARSTGARYAVAGSALTLGGELRLVANVYETSSGERVGRASVRGEPGGIIQLSNALTKQLLGILLEESGADLPSVDLADLTTHSPPALKAYLAGERHYRDGNYRPAVEDYRSAIEQDSSFALAYVRLAESLGWTGGGSGQWFRPLRKAYQLSDQLPIRLRRLVWSQYAWAVDGQAKIAADTLEVLTRTYPSDPGIWYEYGEVHFHTYVPGGWKEAERAFERAAELDPDVAPYNHHLMDLAMSVHHDSELAARRIAAHPDGNFKRLYGSIWDLNFGSPRQQKAAWTRLDTLTPGVALRYWIPWPLAHPADQAFEERVIRRLMQREDTDPSDFMGHLVENLIGRGRIKEAVPLFPKLPSFSDQTCYLALPASVGYAIPDSLLAAEEGPSARDDRQLPVCSAARWIALGENDSVAAVLDRLREADTTEADPYPSTFAQQRIRAVRGLRAWTSGRPKEAVDHWAGFNNMGSWGAMWRGDAYRRLDRLEEAEQWYLAAWEAPIAHERMGRLYEEMGRLDEAASAYDRFLAAWNDVDEPLRERVRRVRARRTEIMQEQQLRSVSR